MNMRSVVVLLSCLLILLSCSDASNKPDVSNIQVNLVTERFEKNLFDTTSKSLVSYLIQLQEAVPSFTSTYLRNILNVDPAWSADTAADYVNGFILAYRPVYEKTEQLFGDFKPYEKEIQTGLKHVKFYFPQYKIPGKIITYIGPADGYGDILSEEGMLVGLQHHLGKDYPLYRSELVQQTYPEFISRRFQPEYIAVNSMKNIVDDLYPEKEEDKPLINQMIEKGKRLYLLSRILPDQEEYRLIGYTKEQLKETYNKEAVVWDLFIKNSYLQVVDKNIIKNYLGDSPKTAELGEGAPGNIGTFAGWQIVKKYMQKNPELSLTQLMSTDTELIFQVAKYKP